MLFEFYQSLCDEFAISKDKYKSKVVINLGEKYLYSDLIRELKDLNLQYIASSEYLKENIDYGEYLYYFGESNGIYIMYYESTHTFTWPSRIMLYDQMHEFEVITDESFVNIYETNPELYKLFTIDNDIKRQRRLIHWLRNTDREFYKPKPIAPQLNARCE